MSHFDKILTFEYKGEPHMLLRVLNYGKDRDDLKFTFLDKRFQRGVIHTKESLTLKRNDIITDYGEISYHSDGSVLWKHPRYHIETDKYINPKEEGFRRRKLSEITDWEPIAKYEVFNYWICKVNNKFIQEKSGKIILVSNRIVFDGKPFGCLINLSNRDFNPPNFDNPTEEILLIPEITNNLDLWIVIYKIDKKGNYLEIEGMDKKVFTTNNIVQIVEKNA
jgi:hypothetical protein